MKKIILISLLIGGVSMSVKADMSAYDKLMVKYCVPKNGRCDTKATFTGTQCNCPSGKLYVDRECLTLKCPAGTYMVIDNNTDNCSPGMGRNLYRN